MTPQVEAQIGVALRRLLNGNGLSHVKIVGYEVSCFPICSCHTDCNFAAQLGYCWSVSGPTGELLPLHWTRTHFVLVDASFWRFFCWCRISLLCRICLQSGRVHECIPRQGNTQSDVAWTNLLKPRSRKCISQNVVELLALLGGTILKWYHSSLNLSKSPYLFFLVVSWQSVVHFLLRILGFLAEKKFRWVGSVSRGARSVSCDVSLAKNMYRNARSGPDVEYCIGWEWES